LILVVDDEPGIRDAIGSVLEDEGYAVTTAGDGRVALQAMHDGLRPCLAILDLMMPVMTGVELCRAMERDPELADVPVVIVSAYARGAEDLQVDAVIHKPFGLEEIIDLAERYCGASPRRESAS
jgi:CheY-like chemotaxis protein